MDGIRRITFAIAVFDELRWLRAAVIHLLQFGYLPEHLFLLAQRYAYDGKLHDDWHQGEEFALKGAATWVDDLGSPPASTFSAPSSRNEQNKLTTIRELARGFHEWLMPDQAHELDHHLTKGSGALFVSVIDEEKVAESCQVLMRYSSRIVQTHQVKV